jgi:molybdopterin-guanine dinucleotide biosynthesis protein A
LTAVLAGIFVGGGGTRMGGVAKGLLHAPGGGTLLDRWLALLEEASIRIVLVGHHPAYAAYAAEHALSVVGDAPAGIGPLGGLVPLLERADSARVLALACDMPFVSASLVERLVAAPDAAVVAPRRDGRWEPLCARYDPARVLPVAHQRIAAGRHALGGLIDAAGGVELSLEPGEERELEDWDRPADL